MWSDVSFWQVSPEWHGRAWRWLTARRSSRDVCVLAMANVQWLCWATVAQGYSCVQFCPCRRAVHVAMSLCVLPDKKVRHVAVAEFQDLEDHLRQSGSSHRRIRAAWTCEGSCGNKCCAKLSLTRCPNFALGEKQQGGVMLISFCCWLQSSS